MSRIRLDREQSTLQRVAGVLRYAGMVFTLACLAFSTIELRAQDESDDAQEMLKMLKQHQESIQKLLPKLEAATVCLEAGGGSGSGVIVNEEGLIVTAAHVVEGQQEMTVRFANGKVMRCKVLGGYRPADAALAQIIEEGPHPFVDMAPSGSIKRGQTVIALGNPSGFDEHRGHPLRYGHINSVQSYQYTCDCALIGGDSGGPAFNLDGEVIGIHSTISSNVSTNNDIMIDIFHREWDSMLQGEWRGNELFEPENREEDVVFGVRLFAPEPEEPIRIQRVVPDSPADWAGLKAEDRILKVNDQPIGNSAEFVGNVLGRKYGIEMELTIQRDDEQLVVSVSLLTRKQLQEKRAQRRETENDKEQDTETQGQSNAGVDDLVYVRFSRNFQQQEEDRQEGEKQKQEPSSDVEAESDDRDNDDPEDQELSEKTELQQLFDESQEANGQLNIERERLMKLRRKLSKRMEAFAPAGGRAEDQWTRSFESVFQVHLKHYSQSVFPVLVVGRNVASATVVDSSGLLLTKLSEIEGRKAQIRIQDEIKVDVEIVARDNRLDLALIQVNADQVGAREWIAIEFQGSSDVSTNSFEEVDLAAKGTICCSISGRKERAAGLGIVSVASRSLDGRTTSYLGVDAVVVDDGIKVNGMMAGGPAERSGLKAGDVINSVDNEAVKNLDDLKRLVESHLPGEQVQLGVVRDDSWFTLPATLGDKSKVAPMPGAAEQGHDSAATAMSRRRWNFTQGIQHDCAIQPKACGGLLIDLDGRVIGFNIARAGRIKSYAIPTLLVKQFVDDFLTGQGASE